MSSKSCAFWRLLAHPKLLWGVAPTDHIGQLWLLCVDLAFFFSTQSNLNYRVGVAVLFVLYLPSLPWAAMQEELPFFKSTPHHFLIAQLTIFL